MYPQHFHVCANVVILSLLHVPATCPCYMSLQCVLNKFLSLRHVAATYPCNMTPRVCPLLKYYLRISEHFKYCTPGKVLLLPDRVRIKNIYMCIVCIVKIFLLWFSIFSRFWESISAVAWLCKRNKIGQRPEVFNLSWLCKRNKSRGGYSHIKVTGVLVVPFRG